MSRDTVAGWRVYMPCADDCFGWWDDRETALEFDPEKPDAHATSSLALKPKGRYNAAAADAKRAPAPGSAEMATFASFVLASSGFAVDAVVRIEMVMTLSPNNSTNNLGPLEIDKAIADFFSPDFR